MKQNTWLVIAATALLLYAFRRPLGDVEETIVAATTQDSLSNERKYAPYIAAAEIRYKLPTGMLLRLIRQESHFRTDIITGTKKSPVGAIGIAQFMPATAKDLGVDPLDPVASIGAAARYLAQLYTSTGDWTKAVAAYNYGIGNVLRKVKAYGNAWADHLPTETKNYIANIV